MRAVTLQKAWQKLKDWYEIHQPFVLGGFNDPVDPLDLVKAEEEMGVKFPEQLKDSLLMHNGTDAFLLFDGRDLCRLLSLNEIRAEFKMQQMNEEASEELAKELKIPSHPKKIPTLLYSSGDLMYTLPDTGQMTYIAHDADGYAVFENLATFIHQLANRLEKGRYQVDEFGNLYPVDLEKLWMQIRKFLDSSLAHQENLFQAGMDMDVEADLLEAIKEAFPMYKDFHFNDLPQSLRTTLQLQDGQRTKFKLFFHEEDSYWLLSATEIMDSISNFTSSKKLIIPILQNDEHTLGIDLLSEELYQDGQIPLGLDWTDYLLDYWTRLDNHQFKVEEQAIRSR